MEREGCAPGYEHRGNECYLKNRVRNIPFSVTSKAGCLNFGGKWLDEYSVCVMHDEFKRNRIMGWTAPVRGLYFIWAVHKYDPSEVNLMDHGWWEWIEDLQENSKKKINPADYAYEGSMAGCLVKENKGYPNDPDDCHEAVTPVYIWELMDDPDSPGYPPKFEEIGEKLRDVALVEARRFLEQFDREELHRYKYFDQAGRKLPMWREDAIPVEINRESGFGERDGPSFSGRKPFGVRRYNND